MTRIACYSTSLILLGSSVSCMTTYDSYGRPMQTVDPGLAVVGVAAAGLIGYALANDNHSSSSSNNYYRTSSTSYYSGGGYGGGHDHCYDPCYDY